ncbi:MAG: hypothetical protein E7620_09050, partial [Ruminococcaceae bacterium]|nr:hypothetical protein [Oscillospiraceae bacterium]
MQPLKKDKTYEILFIGNSYTFFNSGVPAELKALATCAGYSVNVDSVTKGGYALEQFADVNGPMGQQVREKLLEKRY